MYVSLIERYDPWTVMIYWSCHGKFRLESYGHFATEERTSLNAKSRRDCQQQQRITNKYESSCVETYFLSLSTFIVFFLFTRSCNIQAAFALNIFCWTTPKWTHHEATIRKVVGWGKEPKTKNGCWIGGPYIHHLSWYFFYKPILPLPLFFFFYIYIKKRSDCHTRDRSQNPTAKVNSIASLVSTTMDGGTTCCNVPSSLI